MTAKAKLRTTSVLLFSVAPGNLVVFRQTVSLHLQMWSVKPRAPLYSSPTSVSTWLCYHLLFFSLKMVSSALQVFPKSAPQTKAIQAMGNMSALEKEVSKGMVGPKLCLVYEISFPLDAFSVSPFRSSFLSITAHVKLPYVVLCWWRGVDSSGSLALLTAGENLP